MSTQEAYRRCEAITRATAANFYYGIRLLAPERRRAMCAVYAFARRVDDIGDGELAREEKLRRLDAQARALAGLCGAAVSRAGVGVKSAGVPNAGVELPHAPGVGDGDAGVESLHDRSAGPPKSSMTDPVMVALADAYERFGVPPDALEALIEGVRMDVEGVAYESFDELVRYCRRVAGAIGRACLAIFALRDPAGTDLIEADRLADDLGVALQLTNILRDVREDAHNGRVYLPAEDLRRFGLVDAADEPWAASTIARVADGRGAGSDGAGPEAERLQALVRYQAERARGWFERGVVLAPLLDRRSAACLLAMSGIYSRLLRRIAGDPERALRERIALSMREKAWVAARSMIGGSA